MHMRQTCQKTSDTAGTTWPAGILGVVVHCVMAQDQGMLLVCVLIDALIL